MSCVNFSILRCAVFLLVFYFQRNGILALRNVRILASEAVKAGESMRLICEYDLENALLYSIKWYFNENEFYRFVPKESPPTRVFPMPGITVDMSQSDNKSVTIRSVARDQTGYYKCEVSADAPLFHTDIKKILIVVTEQPEVLPFIKTDKLKYTEGDIIRANCTSRRGFPAANITWFINGRKVNNVSDKIFKLVEPPVLQVRSDSNGLESSNSTLEVLATSDIFSKGRLKLTCEATQFNIYRKTHDVDLIEDVPQLAHVLSPAVSSSLNGKIFNKILHCLALCFTLGSYYFKRR
ncbi:uncharacterized protein LOC135833697 [Planococcus citri]|uniref:uncharacterized protein LOC135833697 n=1 Tax=Planococcus citri TaxID=170843 RepID=UPI0031F97A5D